jgi:TusE/DsrC/DsvC family sulfur relay protein
MSYVVNGTQLEADADGYLLAPDYSDEVARVIAQAEGIELNENHWKVVQYLRAQYQEHGETPNLRNMLKELAALMPEFDKQALFDLFPAGGPAKQGARIAGLPKPFGKGGY